MYSQRRGTQIYPEPVEIVTGSSAFTVAKLTGKELMKLRRRNEVKRLLSQTVKRLKSDHRIPPSAQKVVKEKIKSLPVDPLAGGLLKALLDGYRTALPPLEERVTQLLEFGEDVDARVVVLAFMETAEQELLPAKRDERSALGVIYRENVDSHTEMADQLERALEQGQALIEQGQDQLSVASETQAQVAVIGHELAARSQTSALSVLTRRTALGRQVPELLSKLEEVDREIAEEVAGRIGSGGGASLAAWAQVNVVRLAAKPAEIVGRLLLSEARYAEAQECFLRAAELDPEDPVRQLVRAANSAHAADRLAEAAEILGRARDRDRDHPAVVIAELRHGDFTPEKTLERLAKVVRPRTRTASRSASPARRACCCSRASTTPPRRLRTRRRSAATR